jgi:predicted PhzF superfamily epimerase YddE/YHI9
MLPLLLVDAFTDVPFAGNPAAVCVLDQWPSDRWLQNVGREMNLSETAFVRRREENEFELRWFTPTVEVALCGHATLAAAHALWETGTAAPTVLGFHTQSGRLTAVPSSTGDIELDFPAKPTTRCDVPTGLLSALGTAATNVERNAFDYLVEVADERAVRLIRPDFGRLSAVECRGVVVTARSENARYDFVSRYFAPKVGINEDPVTGSAHCRLAEYWGTRLGKNEMVGFQASERGGIVRILREAGRVKLGGRAVTISVGTLRVTLQ